MVVHPSIINFNNIGGHQQINGSKGAQAPAPFDAHTMGAGVDACSAWQVGGQARAFTTTIDSRPPHNRQPEQLGGHQQSNGRQGTSVPQPLETQVQGASTHQFVRKVGTLGTTGPV